MSAIFRYKAFLSYSHGDRQWAVWLHRAIERYRVPKRIRDLAKYDRIQPVFRDSEELPTSSDLTVAIRDALHQSESLVVLCSPQSAKSRWVSEEVRLFKELGRQDNIHCVIVGGQKDEEVTRLLPSELRSMGDRHSEPIAADARPHADGKDLAKIKLLAGLLGVGVDALRSREMQRRHRRWMAFSFGLSTALIVMTMLVVIAVVSRQHAVEAEKLANQRAQTARQVADFLVDQFEVSDPGVIRGDTVTAREILERSESRLPNLNSEPLVRARLMQTIGVAYMKLGLYQEALNLLAESLDVRRTLLGESHADVASANAALGQLKMVMGTFEEAEGYFLRAVKIAEEQVEPETPELASMLNSLGVLYSHGIPGKHDQSEVMFQRALEIRERLLPPSHADVLKSQSLLASRFEHVGRTDDAKRLYEEILTKYERQFGPDYPDVAWTVHNLADIHSRQGDAVEAERLYLRAMRIREKVYGDQHPELAWTQYYLASHYLRDKEYEKSEELFQRALAIVNSRFGPRGEREGVPWYLEGLESQYARLLRETGHEQRAEQLLVDEVRDDAQGSLPR